jgi:prevent-host-death family protein
MNTVTVTEARDQLPELLRKVAAGESVILTDGGKPVATLGPPPYQVDPADEERYRTRAEQSVRELMALREEVARGLPPDFNILDILEEERRGDE